MSAKKAYKTKKKLHTSLGQASKEHDLAHLQKPIQTSVFGLKHAIQLLDTATEEVRRYITYECELVYECRVCRTMFRSLANFIYHKREFCKERVSNFGDMCSSINKCPPCPETIPMKIDETIENRTPEKPTWKCSRPKLGPKKKLSLIISKLGKQKNLNISEEDETKEIVESFSCDSPEKNETAALTLEQINGNVSGVFQTLMKHIPQQTDVDDLMKNEVMEIHSILNDDEAILGPDGKAIQTTPPKSDLICTICKQMFSTKKTLTQHIKYKHNDTKLAYLCPENGCKGNIFANAWSVFRHLFKVHRKSSSQVRKLRSRIQATILKQSEFDSIINNNNSNHDVLDTDPRICPTCGKQFERKAAQIAHRKYCTLSKPSADPKPIGSKKRKQTISNRNIQESPDLIIVDENSSNSIECYEIISDDDVDDEEESMVLLNAKADCYMSINELKCIPCGATFRNRRRLLRHMCAHFKWFQYQCAVCLFKTSDRKSCMAHVRSQHPVQTMRNPVTILPYTEIVRNACDFQHIVFIEDSDNSEEDESPEPVKPVDNKEREVQEMIMEVIFGKVEGDVTVDLGARPVRRSAKLKDTDFVYEEDFRNNKELRVFNVRKKKL